MYIHLHWFIFGFLFNDEAMNQDPLGSHARLLPMLCAVVSAHCGKSCERATLDGRPPGVRWFFRSPEGFPQMVLSEVIIQKS